MTGHSNGASGTDAASTGASDDGVTLRERQLAWDDSTRPSAPPPPDGHVYTRHGKAVGRHLAQVHDHLRSELSQVRELLIRQSFPTCGRPIPSSRRRLDPTQVRNMFKSPVMAAMMVTDGYFATGYWCWALVV